MTLRLLTAGLLAFAAWPALADDKKPDAPKTFANPTEAINHFIRDGYAKAKITSPAAKATDLEFLRRAYIDLIGRSATVEEVLDYERDTASGKRARLVHRLINESKYTPKVNGQAAKKNGKPLEFAYNDEFAEHWADIWSIWLMSRTGDYRYREQMKAKLTGDLLDGVNHKEMVTRLITAEGKSNQNGYVNFIIHHLGEPTPNEKRDEMGPFDAVPITSRVTRLFLGIQTNCTQCHDHPFNKEWVQADFWGVNAYFRQTLRSGTPTGENDRRMQEILQIELKDDTKYNNNSQIFYERRDGSMKATRPNFLKDLSVAESGDSSLKPIESGSKKSRRQVLADYVTSHDNFARAYVNRIWGHLFGRGLNKEPSLDDFGSHNEVVHPELLDYLAKKFIEYNYDQKKLIEWICCSEVYSLSHVANTNFVDPKYDAYFARMPLKALSPEVLFRTLKTATDSDLGGDKKLQGRNRQNFIEKLVANFGDDEGNEVTFNGTVVQALLMMNGSDLNKEINARDADNPVAKIIAKHSGKGSINSSAVIDELFLAALNRHPKGEELTKINNIMSKGAVIEGEKKASAAPVKPEPAPVKPVGKGDKNPKKNPPSMVMPSGPRTVNASGPNDVTFYQDLFWALLNTNEFMLNH